MSLSKTQAETKFRITRNHLRLWVFPLQFPITFNLKRGLPTLFEQVFKVQFTSTAMLPRMCQLSEASWTGDTIQELLIVLLCLPSTEVKMVRKPHVILPSTPPIVWTGVGETVEQEDRHLGRHRADSSLSTPMSLSDSGLGSFTFCRTKLKKTVP